MVEEQAQVLGKTLANAPKVLQAACSCGRIDEEVLSTSSGENRLSLPQRLDSIRRKFRVARYENQVFYHRLSNEKTIKRVVVV